MMPTLRHQGLIVAVAAVVLVGCGTATPSPAQPGGSPDTAPTPVPVTTPSTTPSPTQRPGDGLGCTGPIGRADELVLVTGEGTGFAVDAIALDGGRRRIAIVEDAPVPIAAQVSPCGHLAFATEARLQVLDLRAPGRRLEVSGGSDGGWGFDREGRLTAIESGYGTVVVFDPRDGGRTSRPWNGDVVTYPEAAWDGSGWRAEVSPPGLADPPARVGVVAPDGTFRQSALLVFQPHGFLWWTSRDGAQAWVRWGGADETAGRDLYLQQPDGGRERWHRAPAGRRVDERWWDATGETVWLLEHGPDGLHVLHATGPGQATDVIAREPIPGWWRLLAIDHATESAVLGGGPDSGVAGSIVRLDLADGDVTRLVDDLAADPVVAGWAAPPTLPAGVVPPAPFGTPETEVPIPNPTTPAIPALPVDALALVTCSASGTVVARPTVRALEDGVHFRVLHPDGSAASVEDEAFRRIEGYQVVSLPPGPHVLDCGEGPGPTPARIEVLDPGGLYGRPPELTCENAHGVAAGVDGDPVSGPDAVAWLRTRLIAAPGDRLEPAGYPAEAAPPILLVRDGRAVALFHLVRSGDDIGVAITEQCPDANISW